jgi:signal transduction histidine kinase
MATFRARARTVDLLGRQQIAGIPTAISELFKNAHDAYASRVEVDYFRQAGLFVLRDDGLGMTPDDFVDRWLTLGTESKLGAARGLKPPPSLAKQKRAILGEKGIGRLAIASIGDQVLVLTRPRLGRRRPLTAALVSWRLFELPGINLDQIEIPMSHNAAGLPPDAADLKKMVGQLRRSLVKMKLTSDERDLIAEDLKALELDPRDLASDLGAPQLSGRGHGTHFIVTPTREQLDADIDGNPDADDGFAPPLIRTLIGFGNTMTPDAPKPVMVTAFRDHKAPDDQRDVIKDNEFFTPQDFAAADHHIDGWFDETGFFEGTVDVYGEGAQRYALAYSPGGGREIACGGFRFRLAYVQGVERDSRLDLATYGRVSEKLKRIGGIYIYREGIRVMPYGSPDFDFLGIEQRRSENIGRYFFSYRRMFGVIELDADRNAALREKAGREGFREDRAYRDFKQVLRHFLKQVAVDYFSKRGEHSDRFFAGRRDAQHRHAQRQAREQEAEQARNLFGSRLTELAAAVDRRQPDADAGELLKGLGTTLSQMAREAAGPEGYMRAEIDAVIALNELRQVYQLSTPAGFGLTPELRREYDWVSQRLTGLEETLWQPTATAIGDLVEKARKAARTAPDRQQRLIQMVRSVSTDAERRANEGADEARSAAHAAAVSVETATRTSLAIIEEVAEAVMAAASARTKRLSQASFVSNRIALERQLLDAADREAGKLMTLAERLRRAAVLNGDGPVLSDPEAAAVLEEEVLELRERVDRDFELAQLGMATQVITHELDAAIVEVRGALRRLSSWVDVNPELSDIHEDLRTAFDHLDGYLSLFTPLQRRLRRKRETLTGEKIEAFVARLFGPRLEGLGIKLRTTERFHSWHALGFRSALYPAFINLIDNASYWVRQAPPPYWIRLDSRGSALIVADSGPGIPERDRDVIWEFGFSRKPGGRGAGLHITREVMGRDGWEIEAVNPQKDEGARFRLTPPAEE